MLQSRRDVYEYGIDTSFAGKPLGKEPHSDRFSLIMASGDHRDPVFKRGMIRLVLDLSRNIQIQAPAQSPDVPRRMLRPKQRRPCGFLSDQRVTHEQAFCHREKGERARHRGSLPPQTRL